MSVLPASSVRVVAAFWGLVLFMPVGMNYLAFFALLLAMLLSPGLPARWARFRSHPLWWPSVAFVAVQLLALALMPRYPETVGNLWHGGRIVATLALALMLDRDETLWGLRAFAAGAAYALVVVLVHQAVGLPDWPVWQNLQVHLGNKSIADALLFALAASTALLWALERGGWWRWAGVGLAAVLIAIDIWWLPSRTSVLGVLVVLVAACVHRWRRHRLALTLAIASCLLLAAATIAAVPFLRERFELGVSEVQRASVGDVAHESWSVRYHMYTRTWDMIRERPWTGWGIGSWNTQWRGRVPELLHGYNMPHNDFLWMGAQAGVMGALILVALAGVTLVPGWRRQDLTGRLALAAGLTLIQATCWNSAMRDAAIGLSLLWVTGLYLRIAQEEGDALDAVFNVRARRFRQP